MIIDIGNRCVECKMDTSMGSGRYVNRIPADRQDNANSPRIEGYLCADCQAIECDICHKSTIDYELNFFILSISSFFYVAFVMALIIFYVKYCYIVDKCKKMPLY